jgi:hypothetical protein
MPSINLLPENFTIEANRRREKTAIYILAVFFVLSSAVAYGFIELQRREVEKKTKAIDVKIENVKTQIKNEIEKSDLLSSDYNKNDIEKVLGEHTYASKGLNFFKGEIIKGVYLESLACTPADGIMEMKMVAMDYDTLIKQLLILEDSFWVKTVEFGEIAKSKENGTVSVDLKTTLRTDLFGFQDQYWDYGLGVLSRYANRYIEITSYAINLQKSSDGIDGDKVEKVKVTFEGKTYDKDRMEEFEKSLKGAAEVENLNINMFSLEDDDPGVVNFRGDMNLSY